MTLTVRPMQQTDVASCLEIINHTIALGGTTADETPYTLDSLTKYYFNDTKIVNVVEHDGRIVGFQGVFEKEPGLYSIGTFTDRKNPVPGAGRALAEQMVQDCRADGGHTLIAKITSDNTGGLQFYSKVGFTDWKVLPNDLQRKNGTWVDRVVKRIVL